MNNLRTVKKDIVYLVNEVISDCWVYLYLNNNKNKETVVGIITDAIALGDKLIADVNNYPKGKGEPRKFFKVVKQELLTGIEKLFQRVNELN